MVKPLAQGDQTQGGCALPGSSGQSSRERLLRHTPSASDAAEAQSVSYGRDDGFRSLGLSDNHEICVQSDKTRHAGVTRQEWRLWTVRCRQEWMQLVTAPEPARPGACGVRRGGASSRGWSLALTRLAGWPHLSAPSSPWPLPWQPRELTRAASRGLMGA